MIIILSDKFLQYYKTRPNKIIMIICRLSRSTNDFTEFWQLLKILVNDWLLILTVGHYYSKQLFLENMFRFLYNYLVQEITSQIDLLWTMCIMRNFCIRTESEHQLSNDTMYRIYNSFLRNVPQVDLFVTICNVGHQVIFFAYVLSRIINCQTIQCTKLRRVGQLLQSSTFSICSFMET